MNPGHINRYVYLLHDATGKVLYVGMAANPMNRIRAHMRRPWGDEIDHMTIHPFRHELDAVRAEKIAIAELRPPHNLSFNPETTRSPDGSRKEQVVWALRESGVPMTQTEVEQWLSAQGVDGVKSFVGQTLLRLWEAGIAEVAAHRPRMKGGRWTEVREYVLTEEAA